MAVYNQLIEHLWQHFHMLCDAPVAHWQANNYEHASLACRLIGGAHEDPKYNKDFQNRNAELKT